MWNYIDFASRKRTRVVETMIGRGKMENREIDEEDILLCTFTWNWNFLYFDAMVKILFPYDSIEEQ